MSFAQHMAFASTIAYYLLLLLAALGGTVMVRQKQWKALFLTAFTVVFVTFATVFMVQGETRFKARTCPISPYLAAAGAVSVWKKERL